jgi:MFS family permease
MALGLVPRVGVLVLLSALCGVSMEVCAVAWVTSLQQNIPENALSRVFAYDSLGSFVAIPVGQLLAGPLAGSFGASSVVVGAGTVMVVFLLAILAVPDVRRLRTRAVAPVAA